MLSYSGGDDHERSVLRAISLMNLPGSWIFQYCYICVHGNKPLTRSHANAYLSSLCKYQVFQQTLGPSQNPKNMHLSPPHSLLPNKMLKKTPPRTNNNNNNNTEPPTASNTPMFLCNSFPGHLFLEMSLLVVQLAHVWPERFGQVPDVDVHVF